MALTSDYLKLVIYGTFSAGDIWQTGFHIRTTLSSGSWALSDLTNANESMAPAVSAWWTAMKAFNGSSTAQAGHKVYAYAQSGGNAYSSADHVLGAPVVGTGSTFLPPFCSAVQSLRSSGAGSSSRGRMYAPAQGIALQGTGQMSSANATSMATATAALITAINALDWTALGSTSHRVTVLSRATSTFHDVSVVKVDTNVDVQHRRTNRIPAASTASVGV